jgi:hypothetical protein
MEFVRFSYFITIIAVKFELRGSDLTDSIKGFVILVLPSKVDMIKHWPSED